MSTSPPAQPTTSESILTLTDETGAAAGAGQGDGDPPGPPAQSNAPPLLPSSCLAALLDFLPFQDVRQCLLAGKVIAVGAAREVETLNIMKASEMVAPAVRRFPNVSELNILSILPRRPLFDDDNDDDEPVLNLLSANAIRRAVPFMVQFSKLRGVFLRRGSRLLPALLK